MQFQEFAAVVLIQAAVLALGLLDHCGTPLSGRPAPVVIVIALRNAIGEIRIRTHAQPVVEVKKHCGTVGGRDQQVLELAHRMRSNHVTLVAGEQVAVCSFSDENI